MTFRTARGCHTPPHPFYSRRGGHTALLCECGHLTSTSSRQEGSVSYVLAGEVVHLWSVLVQRRRQSLSGPPAHPLGRTLHLHIAASALIRPSYTVHRTVSKAATQQTPQHSANLSGQYIITALTSLLGSLQHAVRYPELSLTTRKRQPPHTRNLTEAEVTMLPLQLNPPHSHACLTCGLLKTHNFY